MNEVLVIGITHLTETIWINQQLSIGNSFNSRIMNHTTGGEYTIAYDLAKLGVSTYFITRLSFDEAANSLMAKLDQVNGMLYSNHRQLSFTPKKVYLIDHQNHYTSFDNIPYDAHPSLTDGLPSEYFKNKDYAIINIINSNFLAAILHYYPNIHYISNNNIPADDLLAKMDGIILEVDYANQVISKESDFDLLANQLIEKGLKWLIITNKGKGAYVFTKKNHQYLAAKQSDQHYLGTHEAFVSMFVACLANDYEFSEALSHAISISSDISFENNIELQ